MPATEATLITRPKRARIIFGSTARVARKVAVRLMSITVCHWSSSSWGERLSIRTPALLTRTSTGPSSPGAVIRAMSSPSAMSPCQRVAVPPAASIWATTSFAPASSAR
jgi:hypothetical protein